MACGGGDPFRAGRAQDSPLLPDFCPQKYCAILSRPPRSFSKEALEAVAAHNWKGNVRELENFVQRLAGLATGKPLRRGGGGGGRKPEEGRGDPGNQPEYPAEKTALPLPPAPEKEVPVRGDRELRARSPSRKGGGAVFLPAIAISGITRQNGRGGIRAGASGVPAVLGGECRGCPA